MSFIFTHMSKKVFLIRWIITELREKKPMHFKFLIVLARFETTNDLVYTYFMIIMKVLTKRIFVADLS